MSFIIVRYANTALGKLMEKKWNVDTLCVNKAYMCFLNTHRTCLSYTQLTCPIQLWLSLKCGRESTEGLLTSFWSTNHPISVFKVANYDLKSPVSHCMIFFILIVQQWKEMGTGLLISPPSLSSSNHSPYEWQKHDKNSTHTTIGPNR